MEIRTLRRPALVLLALAAFAAGVWLSNELNSKPLAAASKDFIAVTLFPKVRPLPALTMVDQDSQQFDFTGIKGQWSLLFMGFTNCGHVCPMTMADLRSVHDQLARPINVIFVSVDPGRDSPDVIRDYVQAFDPGFIGLTGTTEALEKLANSLGAPMFVDTSADNYTVDHSSTIFLLDPSGALAGTITPPFKPDQIAAELALIM